MKTIDELTESFKFMYEKFLLGCEDIEKDVDWNEEEYGQMGAYFANDISCIILSLVVADGNISEEEVHYVNSNFDYKYDIDELRNVYENCKEKINSIRDGELEKDIELLESFNSKLADFFKELLEVICEIVVASDGVVASDEDEVLGQIKQICSK